MKLVLKKSLVLLLAISLMPLYGCGEADGGSGGVPMGRYVEEVLELPEYIGRSLAQLAGTDGGTEIYTLEDGQNISLYKTNDGETWEKQAYSWKL